jgi:hypothetical protein
MPHSRLAGRAAGPAELHTSPRVCPRRTGTRCDDGARLGRGRRHRAHVAGRRAGPIPPAGPHRFDRRSMPPGCRLGPCVWHPFPCPCPSSAVFSGAAGRRGRLPGGPRLARRRPSPPWLAHGTRQPRCTRCRCRVEAPIVGLANLFRSVPPCEGRPARSAMDNLPVHKSPAARRGIEAASAQLLFSAILQPRSESYRMVFSRMKANSATKLIARSRRCEPI